MDFTITIPEELVPGIIATAALSGVTPEEAVASTAILMATKACQDLLVGPYYRGPVNPQFNSDGTSYVPVLEEQPVDE